MYMTIGYDISQLSISAYQNYVSYYSTEMGHDIAASAANMAGNQFFQNPGWNAGWSNVAFNGGTYSTTVYTGQGPQHNRIMLSNVATYGSDTTRHWINILLEPAYFSNFGYFVNNLPNNLFYATGDTVDGPVHSQTTMNTIGNPVFTGKVTSKNGLYQPYGGAPKFLGGFQSGVNISIPTNMTQFQNAAVSGTPPGKVFGYSGGNDLYLTFKADGTVDWKRGSAGTVTNTPLTTLCPNGTILAESTNVHIKGVLNGQVTVACSSYTKSGKGLVYIDSSMTYNGGNPMTNPAVTDMLGIVAENNITVTTTTTTNIYGSMLSLNGGLAAQHYNDAGICGALNVVGGLQENLSQVTGTANGSGVLVSGFNERIKFDKRFSVTPPPFFPATGSYKVISWYE